MYGNKDGKATQLSVTYSGIHSFINGIRCTSYSWVKIRKLGFKRRQFLIKFYLSKDQVSFKSASSHKIPTVLILSCCPWLL